MFLGSVPFPFSLMGFPKQRLLSWLNTLTRTQVSSAVPIHTSWSKLGEFTLNGTAQLFIKELKAAEILVCIAMSVSDNQWESRTSSWWVGGGTLPKDILDCLYLDCPLKPLHQWGVLSLLSFPVCTRACQGSSIQNTWIALLELPFRAELSCHLWSFGRAVLLLLHSCGGSWMALGAAGLAFPAVNGHSSLQEHMGTWHGLGPFLSVLAAGGLAVELSAACLAGLLCTLGHAQLWRVCSTLESRLGNNAWHGSAWDPLPVRCSMLSSCSPGSSQIFPTWRCCVWGHPQIPLPRQAPN